MINYTIRRSKSLRQIINYKKHFFFCETNRQSEYEQFEQDYKNRKNTKRPRQTDTYKKDTETQNNNLNQHVRRDSVARNNPPDLRTLI